MERPSGEWCPHTCAVSRARPPKRPRSRCNSVSLLSFTGAAPASSGANLPGSPRRMVCRNILSGARCIPFCTVRSGVPGSTSVEEAGAGVERWRMLTVNGPSRGGRKDVGYV